MNRFFYSRFALKNIKTNQKLTVPYMISSIFSIAIFYILSSLANNSNLSNIKQGAEAIKELLKYGMIVIAIFIVIFIFYSYSFLVKKRYSEFGLYSVLGMTKKQISKIILMENIILAFVTVFVGILVGIVFDKLAYLFLLKLMQAKVELGFYISFTAIKLTVLLFSLIYILTIISSLIKIYRLNIIKLLKSDNVGEKEPKTRWLLSLVGIALIGYGYYTALIIKTPLQALTNFFYAVVSVIIGTYLLFIAISIFVLKLLKNNKKLYYKTQNFISISNMIYRMKRNAVGLANICILSTMILITLGSTASLYFGKEALVKSIYPRSVTIEAMRYDEKSFSKLQSNIDNVIKKEGVKKENIIAHRYISIYAKKTDNWLIIQNDTSNLSTLTSAIVIPLEDYNKTYNTNITLKDNEILLLNSRSKEQTSQLKINNQEFSVKDTVNIDSLKTESSSVLDTYHIIIKDINVINNLKEKSFDENQDPYKIANNWIKYYYAFDLSDSKNKEDIEKNILDTVQDFNKQNNENSENNRTEMFVMGSNKAEGVVYIFGFIASFLFIGIFISLIFVVSQVMIMYYKQISEGYEDREKFDIMQKVGLDEVDIKKSIRSQILMIFFSPLVVATIHVTVAYPFIEKLLKLFELPDNGIFITTMIGTFVIFALFYIVVYTITSKIYYNIIKLRN